MCQQLLKSVQVCLLFKIKLLTFFRHAVYPITSARFWLCYVVKSFSRVVCCMCAAKRSRPWWGWIAGRFAFTWTVPSHVVAGGLLPRPDRCNGCLTVDTRLPLKRQTESPDFFGPYSPTGKFLASKHML